MALSAPEIERFSRQIILPSVGGGGQERIMASRVVIIGCGGLGCPVALGLAGAGVGSLTLVDDDRIELSNLHRQIAFTQRDVGQPKVEVLGRAVQERSATSLTLHDERAVGGQLDRLFEGSDLVIDASDNFTTRFAVSDACVRLDKVLISGAVSGYSGQLLAQKPGGKPCYRCLFEAEPEQARSCDADGVLPGAVLSVAGMMVQWALLAAMQRPELPFGKLLQGDLMTGVWRPLTIPMRPDCICSGSK